MATIRGKMRHLGYVESVGRRQQTVHLVERDRCQTRPRTTTGLGSLSRTRRTRGADKNDLRRGSSLKKEFAIARICASAKARLLSAVSSYFACRLKSHAVA